jgi:TonB family protein
MKNILFLFLFIPLISIGQATIKGTVTDSFNSPLPGASIYNSSNQKSSTSNNIGAFIINGAIGDVVTVSRLGFQIQTFKVSDLNIQVQLNQDTELEEVVIMSMKKKGLKKNKTNDINLSENDSEEINNPFLDCDINDNECFQNTLNKHVSDNFYYPQLGDYFDIQAMVNVNYTIDKNGVVKNVSSNAALIGVAFEDADSKKIISDAFEKAANSIIESLPKTNPSIVGGIAVDKKFRTSILYRLSDIEKGSMISININKIDNGLDFLSKLNKGIFSLVPVFPGCEKLSEIKKRGCFQEKMNRHIAKHFRYPEIAQKQGIQGRVIIQFVVEKDGNVSGIRTRGPDPILEKEAVRIISLLPKIKPAEIEGRKVRVPFSTSITFKLY